MAKPKQPTALSLDEIELLLESIALDHLFIETLQTAFDAGLRAAGGAPKQTVHRVRKVTAAHQTSGNGSTAALQA